MSPRRRKAEDVAVFAALVRVMRRRGPAELTLREIAAEAGVTAGRLVQRFGSKRALLLAHARHAAASGDLGVTVPRPRTSSPLEALRSVTAAYAHWPTRHVPLSGILPTCTTIWQIRRCVVTCCGFREPRGRGTSSCSAKLSLRAS